MKSQMCNPNPVSLPKCVAFGGITSIPPRRGRSALLGRPLFLWLSTLRPWRRGGTQRGSHAEAGRLGALPASGSGGEARAASPLDGAGPGLSSPLPGTPQLGRGPRAPTVSHLFASLSPAVAPDVGDREGPAARISSLLPPGFLHAASTFNGSFWSSPSSCSLRSPVLSFSLTEEQNHLQNVSVLRH